MHHEYSLHDKREINKTSLDSFFADKYNVLDPAIDDLIKQLKEQMADRYRHIQDLQDLKTNNSDGYREFSEQVERYGHNLENYDVDAWIDISYYGEQLLAVAEMKVVYAFKFLEINLKRLVKASFSVKSTKTFFRWDNLLVFLKDHNINLKGLASFQEVEELRRVNNTIKHSDEDLKELSSIPEFKGAKNITYERLEQFYQRVEKAPGVFLQQLSEAIYRELYEFDEDKLEQLAKEFTLRMTKHDALEFAGKLIKKYNE